MERMSKAALSAVAAAVAAELGWQVLACDYEHCAKIGDGKGQAVTLNSSWAGDGRISISGEYPRDKNRQCYGVRAKLYKESMPSITVAASKSPKAIAGDITRRLLPDYLPLLAKATEMKARDEAFQSSALLMLQRFANLGLRVNPENRSFDNYSSEGGYIQNGEAFDTSCRMDLRNVPPDKAEAIIKIILG